jgi:hypothetical protein
MERLFKAYYETNFHWVHPNPDFCIPEKWKWCSNLFKKTYREFISELDIG